MVQNDLTLLFFSHIIFFRQCFQVSFNVKFFLKHVRHQYTPLTLDQPCIGLVICGDEGGGEY